MVTRTRRTLSADDPIYKEPWTISGYVTTRSIEKPSAPSSDTSDSTDGNEPTTPAPTSQQEQEQSQATEQDEPEFQPEYVPAMTKEAAHAELRKRGATQEQLDLDISHLDRSGLVDPKYLPAIAAEMMQKGQMPTLQNVRKALDSVPRKMKF